MQKNPAQSQVVNRFREYLQTGLPESANDLAVLASQAGSSAREIISIIETDLQNADDQRLADMLSMFDQMFKNAGEQFNYHLSKKVGMFINHIIAKGNAAVIERMNAFTSSSWEPKKYLAADVCERIREASINKPIERQSIDSLTDKSQVEKMLVIVKKLHTKQPCEADELVDVMKLADVKPIIQLQRSGNTAEAGALLEEVIKKLDTKFISLGGSPQKYVHASAGRSTDPRNRDPRQAARDPRGAKRGADPRDPRAKKLKLDSAAAASSQPAKAETAKAEDKDAKMDDNVDMNSPISSPSQPGSPSAVSPLTKMLAEVNVERAIATDGCETSESEPETDEDADPVVRERRSLVSRFAGGAALPCGKTLTMDWARKILADVPSCASLENLDLPELDEKIIENSADQAAVVRQMHPNQVLVFLQCLFELESAIKSRDDLVNGKIVCVPTSAKRIKEMDSPDKLGWVKALRKARPFQCTADGHRFPTRQALADHLDARFAHKCNMDRRKQTLETRGWMMDGGDWCMDKVGYANMILQMQNKGANVDTDMAGGDSPAPQEDDDDSGEEEELAVGLAPFDELKTVCPMCSEPLNAVFNSSINEWVYHDVVAAELDADDHIEYCLPGQLPTRTGDLDVRLLDAAAARRGIDEEVFVFHRSCWQNGDHEKRWGERKGNRYADLEPVTFKDIFEGLDVEVAPPTKHFFPTVAEVANASSSPAA